jgi:hypothetical protein
MGPKLVGVPGVAAITTLQRAGAESVGLTDELSYLLWSTLTPLDYAHRSDPLDYAHRSEQCR